VVLFAGLVGYRVNARNKKQEELKLAKPPATSVSVMKPISGNIAETFSTTGTVISEQEVPIIPKATGRLLSLLVDEGSKVSAGQIIGEIEHSELSAQIIQAQAQLNIAKSNLSLLVNGPLNEQITQADASLKSAQNNLAQLKISLQNTEKDYNRYLNLSNQGAITPQQLENFRVQTETLKKQVESAKQQVISAQAGLKLQKDGTRPEQIGTGKAQVEQAQASIRILQAQQENYQIRSPINGVVTKKSTEPGSLVGMNSPILTISKVSSPELEMNVPEKQINRIKIDQKVDIKSSAFPNQILKVQIREISPIVDISTRLVKIKGKIISSQPVKIGMSFDCTIMLIEKSKALTLPSEAVILEDEKKLVYMVVNNKVSARYIKLGIQTPEKVEVIEGLSGNEDVIYKGNTFVKPGDTIQVQQAVKVVEAN